jgi:hypothetical protein
MNLLEFTTGAMTLLAPQQDHTVMANAISEVITAEAPLFRDDENKFRTASVVIAVAFREGSLRPSVLGDCDKSKAGEPCKGKAHSFCTLQISDTMGGSDWLNENPLLCIQKGLSILRRSMQICPDYPIAWYAAGGVNACTNERSRKISKDRMALAHWLWVKSKNTS